MRTAVDKTSAQKMKWNAPPDEAPEGVCDTRIDTDCLYYTGEGVKVLVDECTRFHDIISNRDSSGRTSESEDEVEVAV
ncbi:hypothetical protein ElyMa_005660900 [Elysia marginata]|uniref:Uncharacterized protein n=1 Tax=Elysia marginata TaxID=1093978 RepID=A0AAV4FCS6_9GAST|nr:hypothetical protein ElyMa_005660900 [Elysia marginata]